MGESTRGEIEDFLFFEAAVLDEWKLEPWLALWIEGGHYVIPATDAPDSDPRTSLALVADDLTHLRARVHQLIEGTTVSEVPRSRTSRMITNVRIVEQTAACIRVSSRFVVHWCRHDTTRAFVGRYEHELARVGDELRIRGKRSVLLHESLDSQGRLSFLL